MKKFVFMLTMAMSLLFSVSNVQAQNMLPMPLMPGDTISMSSSSDTVSKVVIVTGGYKAIGFHITLTKQSGAIPTTMKAYLYRSNEDANYMITDSSAAFSDQTTNVAQFEKTAPGFKYYKVQVRPMGVATGTGTGLVKVFYTAKL